MVYVPCGLITIFVSFYIFYENNRRLRLRREERREELDRRKEELINQLMKSKEKRMNDFAKPLNETDKNKSL